MTFLTFLAVAYFTYAMVLTIFLHVVCALGERSTDKE